jgi:hypothetical protein
LIKDEEDNSKTPKNLTISSGSKAALQAIANAPNSNQQIIRSI